MISNICKRMTWNYRCNYRSLGERLPRSEVTHADDDKLGFVASLDKNPQKARVLLRLALLQPRSVKDVQRIFDEY